MSDPALVWQDDEIMLRSGLEMTLSPAALEALDNGVALIINVQTQIVRSGVILGHRAGTRNHRWEIRYLPLSRHYQLTNQKQDSQQSFPRLWMLLAALERAELYDTRLMRADLAAGQWQVRARAFIDISRLPPPMRLPAWFSRQWRLGSGWHDWEVDGE